MINKNKQPSLSRDYDSELEQLKKIYNSNRKVEQSIIDFTKNSFEVNDVNIVVNNTNTAGSAHAK